MNLRVIVGLLGAGLTMLGLLPVLLVWVAVTVGGGWGLLAGIAAVLTGPLLFFVLLGPKITWFAIKGVPNIKIGRFQVAVDEDPNVVEGSFDQRTR